MIPEGTKRPEEKHTRDKVGLILQFCKTQLGSSKEAERELVLRFLDSFDDQYYWTEKIVQKEWHKETEQLEREAAERCVEITYRIIADLLQIVNLAFEARKSTKAKPT